METKALRLEGVPGKVENQYAMKISVPGKLELLSMIEKPPFHIFSKDETTFSTGILAYVPHSLKIRISRDYQEPFVGLYIKITPKADDIIDISEVKGTFTIAPNQSATGSTSSLAANNNFLISRSPPCSVASNFLNGGRNSVYNPNHNAPPNVSDRGNVAHTERSHDPQIMNFNFFKSSVSKTLDLESYDYYESRCQWPDVSSELDLYVKIAKTAYSVLVNDENFSNQSFAEQKNGVSCDSYFLSDTYSDVAIHVGETVFPAHKIILSERSKYFSRMFASSMREAKEGIVRISDEDESLFREILRFIYQGTVENLEENASELYILSDKYDIPELTCLCEKYLIKQLNVDNAMEMFDLSQSIVLQGLLAKKSKELIMWNRDKFASDLQTFKDFSRKYPEIIFELLHL